MGILPMSSTGVSPVAAGPGPGWPCDSWAGRPCYESRRAATVFRPHPLPRVEGASPSNRGQDVRDSSVARPFLPRPGQLGPATAASVPENLHAHPAPIGGTGTRWRTAPPRRASVPARLRRVAASGPQGLGMANVPDVAPAPPTSPNSGESSGVANWLCFDTGIFRVLPS
jgi:hypothetical protein